MAKPACTYCGENEGALMVTNLDDGDTQIICGPDLPAYALGMAAALTDGMGPEASERYGDALDAIAAHDERTPKPKARRRPSQSDAEGTGPVVQPPLTDADLGESEGDHNAASASGAESGE